MFEYITKYFTEASIPDLIARIVLIVLVSAMYFVAFYYAKKRNINLLIVIMSFALIVTGALSFFDIPNIAFLVYFDVAFFAVACLVFFSQDFRRDMFRHSLRKYVSAEHLGANIGREDLHETVDSIVKACQRMSKTDTGALIIVCDNIADSILDSGTRLNAKVTSDLLETIFFHKTPLHDGAVVITANTIVAASCYLPLTQNLDLPREFGTRHRAAIGICESNPGLTAIVVSEETGIISAMHDGKIKRYLDAEMLTKILNIALRLSDSDEETSVWGLSD